jgi:peptidoglycan/xylan/chitin deacetylase (PgdA/CDA1 family)
MQMRLLALLRYRVIGFDELARALREHRLPPRRAAVVTIDDGYRDNREIAQPVLRRHGFAATIFLVSGKLGGINDWTEEGELSGRPLLSLTDVRELRAEGVRFGAHTRSHCSLPEVADDLLAGEIGGSREDLERDLGEEIPVFAYPYGHHDERSAQEVARSGFAGAGTTHPRLVGLDQDPALIPRVEIRSSDSLFRFLDKLRHGGH